MDLSNLHECNDVSTLQRAYVSVSVLDTHLGECFVLLTKLSNSNNPSLTLLDPLGYNFLESSRLMLIRARLVHLPAAGHDPQARVGLAQYQEPHMSVHLFGWGRQGALRPTVVGDQARNFMAFAEVPMASMQRIYVLRLWHTHRDHHPGHGCHVRGTRRWPRPAPYLNLEVTKVSDVARGMVAPRTRLITYT
jgi:hypothetical protein